MTGRFSAILFDHDGTLVDTISVVEAATNEVLIANGCAAVTRAVVMEGMALPTAPRMGLHSGVGEPAQQQRLATAFYDSARRIGARGARLYDGVDATLAELMARGLRLGVVSNNQGAFIRIVLRDLGISERFACMLGEENFHRPKPDPSGLLLAAELIGVDPRACVYVGDGRGDAIAARAAGMASIGCTWGIHPPQEMPAMGFDALIDRPGDLLAALAFLGSRKS